MTELIKSISWKEWRFVAIMAVIMILVTGLPYLLGWLMTPAGMVYNGLHALTPGDIPIYYSYINQVKQGEILVKNLFTSEPQALGTFNVWWSIVGFIARIFSLSVVLVFQLVRLAMIPIFIFITYLFIAYFFISEKERKVCLLFILFSSGVGFYFAGRLDLINFGQTKSYWWPIDLWLTEANTFNALYQTSHFIASISLMILIFLLMIVAFEKHKSSYAAVAGILSLFYFNFHPYYFPVIFGVLGLYLFIKILQEKKILWKLIGYLFLVLLLSLPSIFYHFWLIEASPVIGQRAVQNVTSISPLIFVVIGYGFLLPGFFLGLLFFLRKKVLDNKFIFLLIWLVVNLTLIYSPFPFHSRYAQGLHIILAIFTVYGLFSLREYLQIKLRPKVFDFWVSNPALLGLLFLVLFMPSNLYSLSRDIYYFIQQPLEVQGSLYLSKDVVLAMDWLSAQPKSRLILAANIPSKFFPGFSGQKVYLAHAHETLFYFSKAQYLFWFFNDNKNDEAKYKFLNKQGIDYIFYSQYEKELGDFDPAAKDYLAEVYRNPGARIYQVAGSAGSP